MARIFIVDDEAALRETFAEYLDLYGLETETFDGGAALRRRMASPPQADVVLLDLTMRGEDGLSLARWLREHHAVGIIMVTGKSEATDRIVGLEIGADDYIAKPVELRELLARIRALLRRLDERRSASAATPAAGPSELTSDNASVPIGAYRLDRAARRLVGPDGAEVALTAMEFDLLCALVERPNRPLSRTQLLDLAHRNPEEPFDRSIDIRIARLRKKIERDPGRPEIIKTVRGVGYIFKLKQS